MTVFSVDAIKQREKPQAGILALEQRDFSLRETPAAFDNLAPLLDTLERVQGSGSESLNPGQASYLAAVSHRRIVLDREWAQSGGTLVLENCSDFELVMTAEPGEWLTLASRDKFVILLRACSRFRIHGLSLDGGRNQLMIDHCSDFSLSGCRFTRAEGYGAILLNAHHGWLHACHFDSCLAAGVMVLGQSHDILMDKCSVDGSRGDFNWDAGLHLCAVTEAVDIERIPELCHEPVPLQEKRRRPFHISVRHCVFSHCRAQGVYIEGAINCLIEENIISGNNKEGLCLDWGASANIVTGNTIILNGRRSDMTEASVAIDHLQQYSLLEDCSSSLKLPGVSLDNAYLNRLTGNTIAHNYGGGIKLVRAAQGNQILENRILQNAIGSNRFIPHSNGISLLSLGAMEEFATEGEGSALLDFLPSSGNFIAGNRIEGHSAAVFQDANCTANRIQGIDLL